MTQILLFFGTPNINICDQHLNCCEITGAQMRKDINIGLLKLMEDGSISQIKNKWWKKNSKCNQVMEFLSSFADLF